MALVHSCFCCGLVLATGFFAVYLLIAYLIAFAFELLWILESRIALPAAAVLLCAGYFTIALFAALLIHGLATKNTLCLIGWMFAVTILTFPEAGMVIFMSIQFWRIETLYGITELTCWFVRIIVNVIELVLVQSLYTIWKDEELVMKRLQDLNMTAIPIPVETSNPLNSQYYQNNAYAASIEDLNSMGLKRGISNPHLWNATLPNNMTSLPFDSYQFYTTQSEFNASVFMPNFINNDITGKKTQSLTDLRIIDDNESMKGEEITLRPWVSRKFTDSSSAIIPSYNQSLGRQFNHQRSKLPKYASVDALNDKNGHVIKNRSGFYAQPLANYGVPIYYGPLDGPDFLIYKKQVDKLNSKNSLSNTSVEDVQKYRDVVL